MKKFKLVSLIILMSMVFSVVIPLKANAAGNYNGVSSFNMYYVEQIAATAGANSISADLYNKEVESHFVNIDKLKENGETVIKLNSKQCKDETNNDVIDHNDMFLISYYTIRIVGGTVDSDMREEFNSVKEILKNNAKELGISDNISELKLGLNVIGDSDSVSYYIDEKSGETSKTQMSTETANIVKKFGGTVKSLPSESEIFEGKYKQSWIDDDGVAGFYYNLENCAKSSLISYEADGKKVYLVFGYENSKAENGRYKCNFYLVTDKTLDPVPDDTKFETELNYEAFIGTKDVGGKLENGTFMPSYDETNIKEDADVTAIINSKNKEEIVKVNNKNVTDTPSNDQPWYYPNQGDKTKVAKKYPFDTYDNSTDNGMVSEKVTLTSSDNKTSEQNVSIKWPFRIIDKTYDPETPTDDTNEVTVTIETNLPMDPNKVPDGWTIVPDTDYHKISKTYKKGEKIDEDVTVYQNKTGDSDKTHVSYTWPGDKTDKSVANKAISQTGEKVSFALIIAVIAVIAAIVINKKKNNLTK